MHICGKAENACPINLGKFLLRIYRKRLLLKP
jgi:hypothetical protein